MKNLYKIDINSQIENIDFKNCKIIFILYSIDGKHLKTKRINK